MFFCRILAALAALNQKTVHQSAGEKSSDMRPPGDSAAGHPQRGSAALQLIDEPEAQKQHRGDFNNRKDEKDRQQRLYLGPGKTDRIGAQDAGDRTAGADDRNGGSRVKSQLGQVGDDAAGKVEQ